MNNYTVKIFENNRELTDETESFADYATAFAYMQERRDELQEEIKDYAEEIELRFELSQTVASATIDNQSAED